MNSASYRNIVLLIRFSSCMSTKSVQCCLTSTETIRTVRDGKTRNVTSTFTQLLSSDLLLLLLPLFFFFSFCNRLCVWVGGCGCGCLRGCVRVGGRVVVIERIRN